ncbi:MAG TPA: diguanylate cyclase [Bryobacteraceae bacterium]|nr:diguanylate cyclase [Bryobacteraceae bacterium]
MELARQQRVLIADDSLVSRHLLEATLRKFGYEVTIACDGKQAWEVLQSETAPPIAILDWMMPGLSGTEICHLVRQKAREPYTYIILLTSKSGKEDVVEGMESGADDYLTKPFDKHELKVRLRAGARIIELQRQLLQTQEELRFQATRDYLTKLYNRSAILKILDRELARSHREGNPLGLVLADIDHFKRINDTHGHLVGDLALQTVADRMSCGLRPYDSVGRYGGEEFLIILPGCDAENTIGYCERLRVAIADEPLQLSATTLAISASFGCTALINHGEGEARDLIHVADEALYRAKANGRNRVELGPESNLTTTATFTDAEIPQVTTTLQVL